MCTVRVSETVMKWSKLERKDWDVDVQWPGFYIKKWLNTLYHPW